MEALNKFEDMAAHIKEYAEARVEVAKLTFQERVSKVISSMVASIIGILLSLFVLLFLSIGISLWLSNYFQSAFIGFFCVSGFYLVVAIVVILNREKWIKEPMINSLIKKMNTHEQD